MRSCSFITAIDSGALAAIWRARPQRELGELRGRHDVVDHARAALRAAPASGAAVNAISFTMRRFAALTKVTMPGDVVGNAELGRRDRERRLRRGHDEIAGERDLARAAPHGAFDHRDHRRPEFLDLANQERQRIVPAQRIASVGRKLVDVVTRRPYASARRRAQDDDANACRAELGECGDELGHESGRTTRCAFPAR